jgi:hypothetical protein
MSIPIDSNRLRAQMAVMCILRNLRIRPGEPLAVDEIARRWADYGIRISDLAGALEDLAGNGMIARRPEIPEQVTQTVAGDKWLGDQPAWVEYQLLMPRASRIAYLRLHEERRPPAARRRRREDLQAQRHSV